MKKRAALATFAVFLTATAAASASNELVLLSHDEFMNSAQIAIGGNDNRLVISQEHTGGIGFNSITTAITGDLNGGPLGSSFSGAALAGGLQPGTLRQSGFNNTMAITVEGTSNLFAFAQIGSGNMIRASITGHSNQAAVMQTGINNHASFSQNGIGNIVSISQVSW